MQNNFLAKAFDWLGEAFEKFNPSAFRFLAATLPYLTPLPVAWLTSRSAEEFLNFTPMIAFFFVVSLEGMGLWFTSLFVDSIVDWIKSRNWKTGVIVLILGFAVAVYIFLLVNLNVTLESTKGDVNPVYSRIVTLLCFLPLISGIGNGYYKVQLKNTTISDEALTYERNKEERVRKEKADERLKAKALKAGINIFNQPERVYQSTIPQVTETVKSDWRLLTPEQRRRVKEEYSIQEIREIFHVGRSTAFDWKNNPDRKIN